MAKGDKFYFENFVANAEFAKKAASYLVECLENYDAKKIEEMLAKMHEIEHSADLKKHEMREALAKAFVTPIDREDLDMLSHQLDDITDLIEEVLQKFYIYDVKEAPNHDDFEAMFILGRQTMNFIDTCGAHTCYADKCAGIERLLKAIGFKENGDKLYCDMTGMFDGHCSGHKVEL